MRQNLVPIIGLLALGGCAGRPTDPAKPSFNQFVIGERVKTIDTTIIRSSPSAFAAPVATVLKDIQGAIIAPAGGTQDVDGDNTRYWNVNFDTGPDGWVSGIYLTSATEGPPPPPPPPPPPVGWFVAPGCTAKGDGTLANPWDLQRALSGGGGGHTVAPGDTIWLRGNQGPYQCSAALSSSLSGSSSAPIWLRSYPGERATIDSKLNAQDVDATTLTVHGQYTYFMDLEFVDSNTSDRSVARPHTIYNQGVGNKFLNLIIHENAFGISNEPPARDVEIAGNIVYNIGTQASGAGGYGHGFYIMNDAGTTALVSVHDNILFDTFGNNAQVSSDNHPGRSLSNIHFIGNIAFNGGTLAAINPGASLHHNFTTGTSAPPPLPMTDLLFDSNMVYMSPDSGGLAAGFDVGMGFSDHEWDGSVELRDNYIVGGGHSSAPALYVDNYHSLTITGNTIIQCQPQAAGWCSSSGLTLVSADYDYVGGQQWSGNTQYRDPSYSSWRYVSLNSGAATSYSNWKTSMQNAGAVISDPTPLVGTPPQTKVFVRHVRYANNTKSTGRAIVAVYNWENLDQVLVPLDGIIPVGRTYTVYNAQTPFTSQAIGTYNGGSITVQITPVNPPIPTGQSSSRAPKTGKRFNAYYITWTP